MKYRVVFMERTDKAGNPSEDPPKFLVPELTDDIVLDATFVERFEPDSLHGQEVMDEDDSFLSVGTEIWEYNIADGCDREFTDALKNSKMVVEYEEIEDEPDMPVK
jgi:hypothetical protein